MGLTPLPSKSEILQRALAKDMEKQFRAGLPGITPEESELKESGTFQEAREDLMRDPAQVSEQLKYLDQMAEDLKLKVIPIKELHSLKRETGYEWTNGWTKHHKAQPKRKSIMPSIPPIRFPTAKPIIHKPKRQRNHTQRTSKTMRVLRKRIKDGQRSFSFPDSIWKVRERRRRR